ncbi:MAG: sporulation integral membrane protein YtvI [Eubacteriales bacterium]|nr:sporulation integral membrane protein YtvI [Eubacteriales bacterium]
MSSFLSSKRFLSAFFQLLLGLLLLYSVFRWLLPWAAPVLLALFLARMIEPAVRTLLRRGFPRPLAAGLCTFLLLSLLVILSHLLLAAAAAVLRSLSAQLPSLLQTFTASLDHLETSFRFWLRRLGSPFEPWLLSFLDRLPLFLDELPGTLSSAVLRLLSNLAELAPQILLFLVTVCVGLYFSSAAYPDVRGFLLRQIPDHARSRTLDVLHDLLFSLSRWLRAQCLMLLLTFFELLAALLLLRVPYAPLLAAGIALVDALPVLGAGTVLVPWALWELLVQNIPLALGLIISYAAVTLLRQCFQAKILGDQLGLHPVASLLAVYAGFRACGVAGMLLFPILLITLQQLNDRNVIHLWNS